MGSGGPHLREEAKEKWAGALGEKVRGLSRGLLPVEGNVDSVTIPHLPPNPRPHPPWGEGQGHQAPLLSDWLPLPLVPMSSQWGGSWGVVGVTHRGVQAEANGDEAGWAMWTSGSSSSGCWFGSCGEVGETEQGTQVFGFPLSPNSNHYNLCPKSWGGNPGVCAPSTPCFASLDPPP